MTKADPCKHDDKDGDNDVGVKKNTVHYSTSKAHLIDEA